MLHSAGVPAMGKLRRAASRTESSPAAFDAEVDVGVVLVGVMSQLGSLAPRGGQSALQRGRVPCTPWRELAPVAVVVGVARVLRRASGRNM